MPLGRMNATSTVVSLDPSVRTCLLRWKSFSVGGEAATAHIWVLHEFRISQTTLVGDANSEMLNIQIVRDSNSASSSPFSSLSPGSETWGLPLAGSLLSPPTTAGFTAETGGGIGSGGDLIFSDTWNNQSEFVYLPLPDARIVKGSVHPGSSVSFVDPALEISCSASATTDNVNVSAVWEEIPFSLDALGG